MLGEIMNIFDIEPKFEGISSTEPNLWRTVFMYYRAFFDEDEAKRYAAIVEAEVNRELEAMMQCAKNHDEARTKYQLTLEEIVKNDPYKQSGAGVIARRALGLE